MAFFVKTAQIIGRTARIAADIFDPQQQQQQPQEPQQPQQPQRPQQRAHHGWNEEVNPEREEVRPTLPNLEFYKNVIPSQPSGAKIESILSWFGKTEMLTQQTGYIQWLFPNRDPGLNPHAFPLQKEEAQAIKSDPVLQKRVLRAFGLILDLYGMVLDSDNKIQLKGDNVESLKFFISHRVSGMWVTRILNALKDLGHEETAFVWMKFLAKLIYKDRVLPSSFRKSYAEFWQKTLSPANQQRLREFTNTFGEGDD